MTVKVKVCMGTHCTMLGNLNLHDNIEELQKKYPGEIDLENVKCLKACERGGAPVVSINGEIREKAKSEEIISEILEVMKS